MKPEYVPQSALQKMAYLMEEAGETIQAAGKLLRWGPHSVNPEVEHARRELAHLMDHCSAGESSAVISAVDFAHPGETNMEWLLRELSNLKSAITGVELMLGDENEVLQLAVITGSLR